jgi:hypothetical protein
VEIGDVEDDERARRELLLDAAVGHERDAEPAANLRSATWNVLPPFDTFTATAS